MKRSLAQSTQETNNYSLIDSACDLGDLLQQYALENAKVSSNPPSLTARLYGASSPSLSLSSLSSKVSDGKASFELPYEDLISGMDDFIKWSLGSLDCVRPSLLRASYALLPLVFLEIVLRGGSEYIDLARNLLKRHSDLFFTMVAPSSSVCEELRALTLLTDPDTQLFSGIARTRAARLRVILGLGERGEGVGAPTSVLGAIQAALEGGRDGVGRPDALSKGAPRLPEAKQHNLSRQLAKIEENLGSAKLGSAAMAACAAPHASSGAFSVGPFLRTLADPTCRATVFMSAMALELMIVYLSRAGPAGVFLLSLFNQRLRVEKKDSENPGEGATKDNSHIYLHPLYDSSTEDVALGILKSASRHIKSIADEKRKASLTALDAFENCLRWGSPFSHPEAFTGEDGCSVPYPDSLYTSSAFGRAVLATAAAAAAADPPLAGALNGGVEGAVHATTPAVKAPLLTSNLSFHHALFTEASHCLRCATGVSLGNGGGGRSEGSLSPSLVKHAVCAGFGDGVLQLWLTMELGTLHLRSPPSASVYGAITAVSLSRCGSWALTGHLNGNIVLWFLNAHCTFAQKHFEQEYAAAGIQSKGGKTPGAPTTTTTTTTSQSLSNSNGPLKNDIYQGGSPQPLSASPGGQFLSREIRPVSVYASLSRSGAAVWALAFNPLCPSIFAAGGRDGCAYIWNTGCSHPQRVCSSHSSDVTTLEWHANGLYLFSGSSDGCGRMWEGATGDCVRIFSHTPTGGGGGERGGVTVLATSPGGRHIATGDECGSVTLWDVPTGEAIVKWCSPVPNAPCHALSFSGGGRQLVTGYSHHGAVGGGAAQTGEQAFALVALWDISPAVILWEKESLKTRGGESSSSVVPHLQPSKNACATLLSVTKFPNTSLLSLVPLRSSESSACEYLVVGSC